MDFVIWGKRLKSSGGCDAAVTARVKIGWISFLECGELLHENKFLLKMKDKICRCFPRSAILYGSEARHGVSKKMKRQF